MARITEETIKSWSFETKQLHIGQEDYDHATDARAVPIYQTSSFVFRNSQHAADRFALRDAGNIYGRLTNPTEDIFEQRMAALEGGVAALGVASGAAAVTYAIENVALRGDHIVSAKNIYGGTYNLLAHTLVDYGVTTTFVDPLDIQNFEKAIQPNTSLVYVETPANPTLKISDIAAIAQAVHKHPNITMIVDSTFASPYLQNPLDLGADLVVHSATKYLSGHGTVTAGVIAGSKARIDHCRMPHLQCFGAVMDPFAAWQLMQGMKTLGVRMERHCENAMKVARHLENHPKVDRVYYPGLESHPTHEIAKKQMHNGYGGTMSVDIKGGMDAVRTVMNNVKVFSLATSLGNVDSLIQHSPSMSHFDMTPEERYASEIYDGQVRLSIGIEDADDLIADLDQALALI